MRLRPRMQPVDALASAVALSCGREELVMNNVDVARCVAWSRTSRITLGCALSLLVVGCDSDVESENSAAEAAAPLSPPAAGAGESPSNAFAAPPSPAASDEVDDACATPPEGAPQCEPGGDGYYWSPYQSVVGSAEGQIPGVDVTMPTARAGMARCEPSR